MKIKNIKQIMMTGIFVMATMLMTSSAIASTQEIELQLENQNRWTLDQREAYLTNFGYVDPRNTNNNDSFRDIGSRRKLDIRKARMANSFLGFQQQNLQRDNNTEFLRVESLPSKSKRIKKVVPSDYKTLSNVSKNWRSRLFSSDYL